MLYYYYCITALLLAPVGADNIVSFPLVPHHEVVRRRALEESSPWPKVERLGRYPRYLEEAPAAQQVAGLFQGYGVSAAVENSVFRVACKMPSHLLRF